MQSQLNVSNANILQNQARGRGQFMQGLLGAGAGMIAGGGAMPWLQAMYGIEQPVEVKKHK